ncbi:hypothetical protein [Puia dinghuensis]|uniref:hypothetical protein n=1 Tax=Puia dinghuensis TaxID=1792502 RepID=UPI0016664217|nr:hypothetical protein [Puia dinghuensis]
MKSQHERQSEEQGTQSSFIDSEPLLFNPALAEEFYDLGFDPKSFSLTHTGSAGPFSVHTHRDPFGEPQDPFSSLEF